MVAESGDSSEACLRRCSSRFPDMLFSSAVDEADEGAEPVALLGLLEAPLAFLGIGEGELAKEMSIGREWCELAAPTSIGRGLLFSLDTNVSRRISLGSLSISTI